MILNFHLHHSEPLVKVKVRQGEIQFFLMIFFGDITEAKIKDFMPYLILNFLNYLTTWEGQGSLPLPHLSLLPHRGGLWEVGSQGWVHHTPHWELSLDQLWIGGPRQARVEERHNSHWTRQVAQRRPSMTWTSERRESSKVRWSRR